MSRKRIYRNHKQDRKQLKAKRQVATNDNYTIREFHGRRTFAVMLLGVIFVLWLAVMAEIAHKQGWFV